ncbi:MAG: MATE family efflux transporter [Oscillospiraceae bacterium]|nr:MATE family efflux transporter [Oscillospiraceae bacterium]
MSILVRDRIFYKKLLTISVPIALQNLITFGVSMMDTVMVGQVGEVQLTAASLAGQIGFIYMIINFGLSSGCGILTAQFWGKKDTESIRMVMNMAYRLAVSIAAAFTLAALLLSEQLMRIYTVDEAVIAEGVRYLRVVGLTYVLYGFTLVSLGILRTVGTVNISVVIYSVSFVVNVFFNWVFIFGNLGAPALGIVGAALGTLIARVAEFLLVCWFLFFRENQICFRPRHFLGRIRREIWSSYGRYGIPVLCNEVCWSIGNSMTAVVMGRVGSEMVAANSIAGVVSQFASVLVQGVANSAAVITGNTIGAGEYEKAKKQAGTFAALSILFGLLAAGLVLATRTAAVDFYNVSDSTKALAHQMMTVLAGVCFFQSVGSVNLIGTLRGGGDSRFVLMCDVGSLWAFAVPAGFLTGLVFHWPAAVVYLFLRIDEAVKAVACLLRLISGKWVRDVTQ